MKCTHNAIAALALMLSLASCVKKEVKPEENKAPIAEAGPDKSVTLPDSVVVTGSGSDTDGKVVMYSWSQIEGPVNAAIVNPGAASTVIRFTIPGSYKFELTVTDDKGAPGVDTVSIVVSGSNIKGNKAPVSNAGPNKIIKLPYTIQVTGSATDVDGTIAAYLWSQVSGPAPSIITNPGTTTTGIKFTDAGTYVFQLMAVDDKGAVGVDSVTIEVKSSTETISFSLLPADNGEFNFSLLDRDSTDISGLATLDLALECNSVYPANNRYGRSLLKFDLSNIPANATIVSANLYLYSYPNPTPTGHNANDGLNNSFFVRQVTSDWSPATAKWANQPTTTTTNQVLVPHSSLSMLDLNLDVSGIVSNMVSSNANYGFMLQLQYEAPLMTRVFISSKNPNTSWSNKFPRLVVVYK